jgi:hypothetical protein
LIILVIYQILPLFILNYYKKKIHILRKVKHNTFFLTDKNEIYINQIISSAQGVPKRPQEITQSQYVATRELKYAQTDTRARPPTMVV